MTPNAPYGLSEASEWPKNWPSVPVFGPAVGKNTVRRLQSGHGHMVEDF